MFHLRLYQCVFVSAVSAGITQTESLRSGLSTSLGLLYTELVCVLLFALPCMFCLLRAASWKCLNFVCSVQRLISHRIKPAALINSWCIVSCKRPFLTSLLVCLGMNRLLSVLSQKQVMCLILCVGFTVLVKNYRVITNNSFGQVPSDMSHFFFALSAEIEEKKTKKQLCMPGFTQQHQTRGTVFFGAVRVPVLGLQQTALPVLYFWLPWLVKISLT